MRTKDEFAILLGQRIREARVRQDMSINELALECGLDYSQLSRIELGKISTRVYTVYQLSKALNIPIEKLFKDIK